MEEEKKKKRGWVKDAAIIFLAVLLVLTFFSNTILNRSLPEVATVYVQEGTITNKVRGTGTVTARENYDVTIDQTRKVQSVLVRVGDEVSVGDVLFTLQPGDSDELENAEKQLKTLEENYQLWLLDLSVADYYEYDRSISDAREALMEAREARDEAEITDADKTEYKEKLAELAEKQAELEAKQEELISEIEKQQALVDADSDSVGELDDVSGALRELELELRRLKDEQHEQELTVKDKKALADAATEKRESMEADLDEDVQEAQAKVDELKGDIAAYGNHQDADYEKIVQPAEDAYDAAKEATAKAEEQLEGAKVIYGKDYDDLVREATYKEFDDKVYKILDDTEAKYRLDNKIAKNEPLTEKQKEKIKELAQPAIDKLGSKYAYEPTQLKYYLPVVAEEHIGEPMAIAYDKITNAQEKLKSCREEEKARKEDYNEAYDEYREAKKDDEDFQDLDDALKRAERALEKAKSDKDRTLSPLVSAEEKAKKDLKLAEASKADIDDAITELEYQRQRISSEDLADRKNDLSASEQKLNDLKTELDKIKADIEQAKADAEQLDKDMEARQEAYKQAKDVVKTRERALEDELRRLDQQKKNDGKQQVRDNITQRDKLEEIEEQRALVEELSNADNGTEVRANVSGKIESLSVSAGHKAEAGSVLATIEVPDLGYSMNFTVTTEQARRLKVGDSATVSNYYWGSQIVATLVSIQTDPQNPQGSRILNFDVTGDVTAGNSITIAVGERNANYDMVVPNSAVRSDTNGSFVLMVTAKNSPLGNRYFATRVNVEVVASDDQYSAISGAIEAYDSVITTASRNAPIASGDQVRLADSNN